MRRRLLVDCCSTLLPSQHMMRCAQRDLLEGCVDTLLVLGDDLLLRHICYRFVLVEGSSKVVTRSEDKTY